MKRHGDGGWSRRRRLAAVLTVLVALAMGLIGTAAFAQVPGTGNIPLPGAHSDAQDQPPDGGDLPVDPAWLANTLTRGSTASSVQNNLSPSALDHRNAALAAWRDAEARWKAHKGPEASPLAKPEYLVVWSAKQNAGDVYGKEIGELLSNATINPQGLLDLLNPQFLPGLDGFQVIDQRKINIDGSENPDYGKVVNFVQLPLPWGAETEAHHMQYEWKDGQPIIAGGLFNDTTFVLGTKDVPNLKLENIVPPQDTPGGTLPDAYDAVGDGRFIGTYMGGPEENFGGSPGEVVVFKPDKDKGLVLESETPAGNIGGTLGGGNGGGVRGPCSVREGRPLGTCGHPDGIQIRQDLKRMVTADYAEQREIVLDPIKTVDKYAFRPTVRIWDTSKPSAPKLISVAHMPSGPTEPAQRAHEQYGIMEDAKTWPDARRYHGLESKGVFSGSMCGGGIFFAPDVTALKGDSSKQFKQVWNDGLSELAASGGKGQFLDEPTGCDGGAWHQVSPSNRILFRSVQGRLPISDNYFDQGELKLVYDVNISPLIKSAQDGHVACDLSRGIHEGGLDLAGIERLHNVAAAENLGDCPRLISTLIVNDPTTGGPHWAALDNHS